MRGWICLAGVSALLVTGCGAEAAEPVAVPRGTPVAVDVPAASSGGACRLLDFAVVEEHTGERFDVAAASTRDDTRTCVLRAKRALLPELALTVTDTSIDVADFTADVQPAGARKVSRLGQVAYRRTGAATKGQGPVAEVGWLAAEDRLAVLRWTLPKDAERAAAEEVAGKLVALAGTVDTRAL
ncbi:MULTISPECIES: hypothetical protein [unclassified Micromonospora]|uniref:hypothetical protein n=1 Tax=unclassified Micromonospora TaxID=2617518 RepID=UPI00098D5C28|nr:MULTISPECIES: hypothetical protein [unclassified Micromonospora]OON31459.1 hypothetical protein BSA16_10695 [Micromonospora sp. Rc5]